VGFVDLAARTDPALISESVASALGVREEPGRPLIETLLAFLLRRELLLVLDNCEHLAEACAGLVERLLTGCPELRILATSRQRLGLIGEVVWRVPSLLVPHGRVSDRLAGNRNGSQEPQALMQYGAVRLFVERALAARPGFA